MDQLSFKVPEHLAIIVDGNRRWADRHKLAHARGHYYGFKNLIAIAKYCIQFQIPELSLFCFSTENWERPQEEINNLFELFNKEFNKGLKTLINSNCKIRICGLRDKLDKQVLDNINKVELDSLYNTGMMVNVCFNYGGRQEILQAASKCEEFTAENLQNNLWITKDVDLIIRTGGEKRLSNFLLWQSSYAELYFSKRFFPDFNKVNLISALEDFSKRNRRFGKK